MSETHVRRTRRHRALVLLGLFGLLAFGAISFVLRQGHAESLARRDVRATSVAPEAEKTPRRAGRVTRLVTFEGACDASGAVELDARRFLVADDEDNVLRVYDADRGGPPELTIDLSPALGLRKPKRAESDFEAATRLGDRGFFLSSHGRTSKGKRDPDRLLLFAVELGSDVRRATLVGTPYRSLLDDLLAHPSFARFGLRDAAERAPKEPGGLNLEGLTAEPDGSLLVGFRSPVPEGRALLVRIANPAGVVAGERARLSEPLLVDLGGLGVRALSMWRSRLLVAAGPSGEGGPFRLYWLEGAAARPIDGVSFDEFSPEGFFTPESRNEVLVLSDDGARPVDGKPCKKVKDRARKRFRGMWVRLG